MWYGLGNTSISNPSTMQVGLRGDGRVFFYNGAVDIGQGSNTIFVQILADALGVAMDRIDYVMGDTDRTRDRSEEHTSELQSLMRISYAVFCLKTKKSELTKERNKTR